MKSLPAGRPSRVLHVLKYYRPDFTGEGVFLERSSAVMQELAPEVQHDLLVTHTVRPEHEGAACTTLSEVIFLSDRPMGVVRRHSAMAAWFTAHLRRYDVVHFRTHADWYFTSYLLSRLAGRRVILSATLDDSLPVLVSQYRPALRDWAARGFRVFDDYVSISPKLLAETRTMAPAEKCHLVPCGITVPPTPPGERTRMRALLGYGDSDPVLLFVGGICERKDPLFLVEAMPQVVAAHPTARLVLVGPLLEPDYVDILQAAIARLGLAAHVHLAGERQDPHPYFAMADMLTFASRMEGFGTVVPEAMAHGLPVAVRHLPGVNDGFVLPDETGYLFEDAPGYVEAVLRLAGDASLRQRLGQAGRRLTVERFGMRGIAARYLSIYGASVPPPSLEETGLGCTASIVDARFHSPLVRAETQPLLVTMVDAEEAFDWSRPFDRHASDVSSMAAQHLAHRVFERHGVVPLYLTDHAVVRQAAGRDPLRDLVRAGQAEIGAQMHPWVTPPFEEIVSDHNSYAGNLPVSLELAKARVLTDALGEAFGEAPRIYRTGRFGAGRRTGDILKLLGYEADTSVTPCWPAEGIPHATVSSAHPYWIDRERTLLELPVSAGLVGRLAGERAGRAAPVLFHRAANRVHLPGALSQLGLLERIRLSPEGMTVEEAKRLVRHMRAGGHGVFVLTYHSPSLVPGNTPYVRDAAQRDRFLAWLDEFYAFFREEIGGRPASWRDIRHPSRSTVPAGGPVRAVA